MGNFLKYVKNKKEEDKKKSSSVDMGTLKKNVIDSKKDFFTSTSSKKMNDEEQEKSSIGKFGKYALEQKIGLDTFQSDLSSMGKTIEGIYGGWQTPETMQNTRASVESMYNRLNAYQDYQKQFGGADISDIVTGYKTVLDEWDDRTKVYGYYKTADAFDLARKNAQFGEKFKGLTYEQVQEEKKKYKADSDEYKFLDTYTQYTDINDFDKALNAAKGKSVFSKDKKTDNGKLWNPDEALSNIRNSNYYKNLETARNKHKLENPLDAYKHYTKNEDFEEKSKYVSTEGKFDNKWDDFTNGQYGMGYSDLTYEYINNVDGMRDEIKAKKRTFGRDSGNTTTSQEERGYDTISPEEVAVYNYIYATEGKDKAQAFLDEIEISLSKRGYEEDTQRWEKWADSGVIPSTLASLASIPASVFGAIPTVTDAVGDAIQGKSYNPYSHNKSLTNFALDTREYVGENIAEATDGMDVLGQNIPSFLYQTGMSIGDSALGVATMKGFYTPLAGSNAFHQKAKEMIEAGESEDVAYKTAFASGLAEAVFEYASIDNFLKIKNVDSGSKLIKEALKQSGIELTEELLTETSNLLSDTIIRGNTSELYGMYNDLIDRGYTESEANTEIAKEIGSRIGWAGVGGFLSGGVMGSFAGANNYSEMSSMGKEIKGNARTEEMLEIASMTPKESEAYKAYSMYADKGVNAENIKNAQLGNLYYSTKTDARDVLSSKKTSQEQKANAINTLNKLHTIDTDNVEAKKVAQRVSELNTGEVTEETSTGNSFTLEGIKFGKDDTTLVTNEGEKSINEVTLSANDAELVAYAEGMTEKEANLLISQYDGKSKVSNYVDSFNLVMDYSRLNYTHDMILEHKGVLSEKQVSAIYAETVKASFEGQQNAVKKLSEKYGATLSIQGTFDDSIIDYNNATTDGSKVNWKDLTSTQRSAVRFTQLFSKATGVNVRFVQSKVKDGVHKGKNGSYDPDTNTIEIDVFAGRVDAKILNDTIIPTLSHEVTHWMKAKSPVLYNNIREEIITTLAKRKNLTSTELVAQELKNNRRVKTEEQAIDELVARGCEDMLSNSNKAKKLIAKMSASEQQDFINKVKGTFETLMQWVNDLLSHYKSNTEEAKLLREYKEDLEKISKMWDEMLVSAVEANKALQKEGVTGEKLARKVSNVENVVDVDSVQYAIRETPDGIKYVVLDKNIFIDESGNELTPRQAYNTLVGQKIMFEDGDVITFVKRLPGNRDMYNELFRRYPAFKDEMNIKAISDSINKNIVETVSASKISKRNEAQRYQHIGVIDFDKREVYVTDENAAYKLTLAIANLTDGKKIAYAKSFIENAPDEIVAEIKKAETVRKSRLNQLSVVEQARKTATSTTDSIISQDDTESQVQNSDRDNLGNTLTEGQAEYFKDSKMRDENGNLLVMYRGDMNEFTVFDRKKSKYGNLYGRGFYFTKVKGHAEQYGKATEYYLNIKNPLSPKQNNITKKQMLNFLKAIENDGEDYDLYNYGMEATAELVLNGVWGKGDFEMIQDINAGAIGDLVAAIELFNEVNGTTYDGIILPSETVTFNSAQSKLTSNENPTDNEDIRYSDRDYSYDELVAKDDLKGIIIGKNQQVKLTPSGDIDVGWVVSEVKKKCKKQMTNANEPTYYTDVPDIGENVEISNNGITHGFIKSRAIKGKIPSKSLLNARVSLEIPQILKNSIEVNRSVRNDNADVPYAHIMIGTVALEDANGNIEYYAVRTVVEERVNQNPILAEAEILGKLHAINAKKIGSPQARVTQKGVALTSSVAYTYKISQFLEDVKTVFDDTFSEDVYNRLGMNRRTSDFSKNLQYSDRETESIYDKMGETDRLVKENEKLKADIDRLNERLKIEKQVTHGNHFNENHLNAVAGHLRKIASSTYSKENLITQLKDVYSYIAQSENLVWDNLFAKCYEVAQNILSEAKPITETDDYAKSILRDIRSKRISLSEAQKQEARYIFGKNYRTSFIGKVMITNDGISLDTQWQEWSQLYPEYFDDSISEADQISALYDIYDDLKDVSEMVVEYDTEEQTRWLATEIYNQYWNVSPIRTTADKYDKKIKLLNFEHRRAMQELRDSYKERIEKYRDPYNRKMKEKLSEQRKAERERYKELVAKVRERKDREIAEVKQHSKERMDKYKENAERKTVIQSITQKALTLNKWLVKNSKDEHIPEALKDPVVNLLQAIDFSSKRLLDKGEPTQKDISLSKALRKVKDMMVDASNGHEDLVELYGHKWDEALTNLVDSVDDAMRKVGDNEFVLNKMTLEELKTLNGVVGTIKSAVSKMNKFHTVNHAQGIANLAQETFLYLDSLGKEKIYTGLRGDAKKLLNWGNALPYYVFKRYGNGGKKVFGSFQDGWDKFAFHIKEIMDYAKDAYSSKDVEEWTKDIRTFKIVEPATEFDMLDPNYKEKYQEVQMTIPQIMSLYCLQKREQAVSHILGGGLRVADIKVKKGEVISQTDGVVLSIKDIATIIDTLTDKQRLVADKLQRFMNTTCTDWGNEVSMLRFGYKAFGEENYFPIQSDKNNLAVNDETEQNNSLFKLLNMSFTKSTIEQANNRIIISDIFDVFAQHTSDMAKYNALALPVLDAFKWYNYTEKEYKGEKNFKTMGVKQSMESAFGKEGQNYFTTFLKDINGQQEVSRDTLGKHFFTNAKIASVGMNIRVALLQPTSYLRASAVINNRYLTMALAHKPKIKMAEKYCGMALWKSMGYYDTNIQKGVEEQIKHDTGWKDKAVDISMKGAEWGDKLTWGYLWNACELEIRKTRKDLKVGSQEFYETIGKRLREIIYATQVVDSTMTRSQMMRSGQMYDKMLTAFASEPTLAYNMLQDAYMEYKLDSKRMGKKEAVKKNGKKIVRVLSAYTATNAIAALVESAFDVFRDDEDEEMDVAEFIKIYLGNFAADMSITAKIPYIKEAVSIAQGFTTSRTDTQWMQSFGYALQGIMKLAQGKGNVHTTGKHLLRSMSYLSGLPFYNAYRDIMATLNKLDIFTSEELEEILDEIFG